MRIDESENTVVILQSCLEDAGHNEALENRLHRSVADRPRYQQDDAVTDTRAEIVREHSSQYDAAAAGLQVRQLAFDEIDDVTGQALFVVGIDAVHDNGAQIPAGLDHALEFHDRCGSGDALLGFHLRHQLSPVAGHAVVPRYEAVRRHAQ